MGRLWRTRSLTLGPRFIGAEHGDWLSWTSRRYGQRGVPQPSTVLLRVESDGQDEKWQNGLALREVAADVFAWSAPADELADGAVEVQATAPVFGDAPAAGSWTLAAGTSGPTLDFAGAVDDSAASGIIFEYRTHIAGQADDAGWIAGEQQPLGATMAVVSGLAEGTSYDGAVSYLVSGAQGDRLILGPVTTAASATAPTPDTALDATGGSGSATIAWRNSTSGLFDHSIVYRGPTAMFASAAAIGSPVLGGLGASMSVTDTVAAGSYYWWVRAFAADGSPGPVTGPATATVA